MIRLYGTQIGNASFARVTAGMRLALEHHGQLAGFVPVDAFDQDASYPGHDADTAVFVGPPGAAPMMESIGWHKRRLLLLPVNSTWAPKGLIKGLEKIVTGFLAPSAWAAEILRQYTDLEVSVWRHGVDAAFASPPQGLPYSSPMRPRDHLGRRIVNMVHFSSSQMERKGTKELIAACGFVEVPAHVSLRLHIFTEAPPGTYDSLVESAAPAEITVYPRLNLPPSSMANGYRTSQIVCQPSVGEGFGMVPLEALCCGAPVIMTDCTGHSEYVRDLRGVRIVPTGELAPIDDGPGALAPLLEVSDLKDAIEDALAHHEALTDAARENAEILRKRWSWPNVTRQWLVSQGMEVRDGV